MSTIATGCLRSVEEPARKYRSLVDKEMWHEAWRSSSEDGGAHVRKDGGRTADRRSRRSVAQTPDAAPQRPRPVVLPDESYHGSGAWACAGVLRGSCACRDEGEGGAGA
eukprot:361278-Chlamydomonas_euryale.AAC.8